jgi:hypothetical protein
MRNIDGDPIRLIEPRPFERLAFPRQTDSPLPPPRAISVSMLTALLRRRSGEVFEPISMQALSSWLYFCASVQSVNEEDNNRQRRYVGSFGALHTIHILLGQHDHSWCVYLPENHSLGSLAVEMPASKALLDLAKTHHFSSNGTLVLLLSNTDLASAYYDRFDELLIKEGGVLLGHASLVAAGLGLAFRILGSNGSPWAEQLIPALTFSTAAVGMAWIGADSDAKRGDNHD